MESNMDEEFRQEEALEKNITGSRKSYNLSKSGALRAVEAEKIARQKAEQAKQYAEQERQKEALAKTAHNTKVTEQTRINQAVQNELSGVQNTGRRKEIEKKSTIAHTELNAAKKALNAATATVTEADRVAAAAEIAAKSAEEEATQKTAQAEEQRVGLETAQTKLKEATNKANKKLTPDLIKAHKAVVAVKLAQQLETQQAKEEAAKQLRIAVQAAQSAGNSGMVKGLKVVGDFFRSLFVGQAASSAISGVPFVPLGGGYKRRTYKRSHKRAHKYTRRR